MTKPVQWSALMHSRTAVLDFRPNLFARPAWFTAQDIMVARRYILGSTRGATNFQRFRQPGKCITVHVGVN